MTNDLDKVVRTSFPGTKPATQEEIAVEIEKSLELIAAGDFEIIEDDDESDN